MEFHTKGGRLTFTARDHTDFVDAFYGIGQDRANTIVVITDTGAHFILGIDFSSLGNVSDPGVWSQVPDEGVQILENLLNIRVPVLAAVEGHLNVHSGYALIANVIAAGEGATYHEPPVETDVACGESHLFPTDVPIVPVGCCAPTAYVVR